MTASEIQIARENDTSIAIRYFQKGLGAEKVWGVEELFKNWPEFEQKVPILAL